MQDDRDEFTRYRERKLRPKSSQEIIDDFKSMMEHEMNLRSEDVQPSHGFWYQRPTKDFPPEAIMHPSEYDDGDRVNIVCTQTELKSSEQKKLVKSWCEVLPALNKVEYVWFSSRANQELFEAACSMKNLKGLYIKWSDIKSIESITKSKTLKYLHIGSAPSLKSLDPLNKLAGLEWLDLTNVNGLDNLCFLANMQDLKGLSIISELASIRRICGEEYLAPITSLQKLKWLQIRTPMTKDGDLLPITKLRSLKYLSLHVKHNKFEEIAKLAGSLPNVECDLFNGVDDTNLGFACKKCGEQSMILLVGKGNSWLCTKCSKVKIEAKLEEFNRIVSMYAFRAKK